MKAALVTSALLAMAVALSAPALADEHPDEHDGGHHYVHHDDWKKGHRMRDEDWKRGERIDYREHHLRAPPAGYEWREVDGNYVLAAVATGVIASVIMASAAGR
ncbi:MAG TPA: RcnB family protein [Steroidobacteraceae bacterium]|nr:RcnB family protein [Steroidobacteraceae bacterium]